MNITKKILSILLCIITVFSCLSVGIHAKETEEGKWVTVQGFFAKDEEYAIKKYDKEPDYCSYYIKCKTSTRNYNDKKRYNKIEIWVPENKSVSTCFELIKTPIVESCTTRLQYTGAMYYSSQDKCYYLEYISVRPSLNAVAKAIDCKNGLEKLFGALPIYIGNIIIEKGNLNRRKDCVVGSIVED